ncbi:hypothetical protein [Demequina lutea]|uniref:Uncharacterized protein n=1 Tax=Demequina lutea TaxID=431489 RepID=A0A7Y9ZCG0_9MICO|nr:hypothetical protein [Demequina lutea]NYI42844.1 hypothetical protein [Demequina lutea]
MENSDSGSRLQARTATDRHSDARGRLGRAVARLSPLPLRWAIVGAVGLGTFGAIAGLIVGLFVHAPTAPFALLEIGVPATLIGGLVGLASGAIASAARNIGARRRN